MSSLLRFSHTGNTEALALPTLKRVVGVETPYRSAKALLPRINVEAPTANWTSLTFSRPFRTEFVSGVFTQTR
jgi:hypothetical protein